MEKLLGKMGYGGLGKIFYKFFYTHVGFVIFTSLHGAFMNTLLIRVTGDSDAAMKFNIISYIVMGFTMAAAVAVTKRTSVVFILRTGVVMYLLMYATFFLMFDDLAAAMPVLATFSGLGGGTYWYANNLGLGGYLTDNTRDKGLGLTSMAESLAGLVAPFISGSIISSFEGLAGYLVVFGLGLAVSAVTVIISIGLVDLPMGDRNIHYGTASKIAFGDGSMFCLMIANFMKGIRMGTLLFFLNLLIYEAVASEFVVGLSNLLAGIMGVLGAMVYGRLVKERSRFGSMWIGTSVLAAGAFTLLLDGPVPIILFSMLNSFFSFFLLNPPVSIFITAIQLPENTDYQGELHGIREIFLSLGKAVGVAFTMYFATLLSPAIAILILTLSQYLMILLQMPIQKVLEKRSRTD